MPKVLFSFFLVIMMNVCAAQNFRGQWKGSFTDKGATAATWGGATSDYVLDIEVDGNTVSGYSYTYFNDGGRKYYTICRLEGVADRRRKYIEVTEVVRTKTNVPVNITNSFQLHKLTWRKEGENEVLDGSWFPAPGQRTNSSFGTTRLMKRQLTEISAVAKRVNAKKDPESAGTSIKTPFSKPIAKKAIVAKKTPPPPIIAKKSAPAKQPIKTPIRVPAKEVTKMAALDTTSKISSPQKPISQSAKTLPPDFENRQSAVLQTVRVENTSVKIELYDNGEIDGDSISLFYNGKVVLAHKRLTDKAIYLDLPVDNDDVNELVMYADNLGTIPPNTALMIVYDGNKRYEVRITSDLKRSGTIRFIHGAKGEMP